MAKKLKETKASEVEVKKPDEAVDIEAVVKRLERETSDHATKSKPIKVEPMSKESKKPKKNDKSNGKVEKEKKVENTVTLSDIAKHAKVEGTELRKALRSSKIKKPGGSWTWPKGHTDIAAVEKLAKSLGK